MAKGKKNEMLKLGEAWFQEDPSHRDLLIITRDGMWINSGVSCDAKHIATMLLCIMPDNAELCEGVKLAAKHFDSMADALRKDEANPSDAVIMRILNAIGYEEESWIPIVRKNLETMEE